MPAMRTAGARMRAGGALLDLHVINAPREPCTIALGVDLFGLVLVQGSVLPSPSLVVTTVAINMARTGDDFSMILEHFVTKAFTQDNVSVTRAKHGKLGKHGQTRTNNTSKKNNTSKRKNNTGTIKKNKTGAMDIGLAAHQNRLY